MRLYTWPMMNLLSRREQVASNIKTFDILVQDQVNYTQANTDKITDFNEGSVIITKYGAVATVLEDYYIRSFRRWKTIVRTAIFESFGFEKKDAAKSTGAVQFAANSPVSGDQPIDIGTIIQTADNVQFVTLESAVILDGQTTSALTSVEAVLPGEEGNVKAGTVIVFVVIIDGVDTVTNPTNISGGISEESDADLAARFQTFIKGLPRTTLEGVKAGALEVNGVKFANSVQTAACEITVYIDDGTGSPPQSLIDDTLDFLLQNNKPAGVDILVQSAQVIPTTIAVTATFEPFTVDVPGEIEKVRNAIANYVNTLDIGGSVIFLRMAELALSSTPTLLNLVFTDPDCEDILVTPNAVARILDPINDITVTT